MACVQSWKVSLKLKKEKDDRCPSFFHAQSIADCPITIVLHCAIVVHIAECAVAIILDRSVVFKIPNCLITIALDKPILIDMADVAVVLILDCAVFFDVALDTIVSILQNTVLADVSSRDIARVLNRMARHDGEIEDNNPNYPTGILLGEAMMLKIEKLCKDCLSQT